MNRRGLSAAAAICVMLVVGLSCSGTTWAQDPGQASEQGQLGSGSGRGGGDRGGIPGGQMVRGVLTAVAADHLTMKQEDGQIYQVVTTPNTRIMKQRQAAKLSDLKAGDGIGAAGVLDASTKTMHAAMIFVVDAEQIRKAQENLGKTYITGKITAIDDLKLTVARPDGVSQAIEVDEGTSFRRGGRGGNGGGLGIVTGSQGEGAAEPSAQSPRGAEGAAHTAASGESITLADVKVGDTVFATGALKAGVFHPVELRVVPPRHRRESAATATPPQP